METKDVDLTQLMNKGTAAQMNGNFAEAERLYREVLLERDGPVIHNNLGFLFLQQGEYNEAITEFEEAIRQKPDYATAFKHLGYAYILSGQAQAAITATRQCFELDSTNADVAETLAKFYFMTGQWDAAAHYRKLAYELSGNAENLTEMAYAMMMQNKFDNAAEALQFTLQHHGASSRVYALLGTVYMMTLNPGLAIGHYKQALSLEPENIEARNNMALCFLQAGNTAEALTEFKRVVLLQPDHWDARNNLAVLELNAGNKEGAFEQFETTLLQQPDNAKALYYKSGLLYQKKQFEEAQHLLEQLLALPDDNYREKAQEMLSALKGTNTLTGVK